MAAIHRVVVLYLTAFNPHKNPEPVFLFSTSQTRKLRGVMSPKSRASCGKSQVWTNLFIILITYNIELFIMPTAGRSCFSEMEIAGTKQRLQTCEDRVCLVINSLKLRGFRASRSYTPGTLRRHLQGREDPRFHPPTTGGTKSQLHAAFVSIAVARERVQGGHLQIQTSACGLVGRGWYWCCLENEPVLIFLVVIICFEMSWQNFGALHECSRNHFNVSMQFCPTWGVLALFQVLFQAHRMIPADSRSPGSLYHSRVALSGDLQVQDHGSLASLLGQDGSKHKWHSWPPAA